MDDVGAVRDTWDAVADAWDARAEELAAFTSPVFERLLAEVGPRPDDVLLELACGTGALGRALASRAGQVVSTDISPRMVEAARRRAAQHDLAGLTIEVADAHDLPYEDDTFTGVACSMGFMLMPRHDVVTAECRRVLRDDGRLVFSTWGPAERNPWVILIGAAFLQHGHAVQGDPNAPGGLFSLSDAEVIRRTLDGAGFADVRTEPVAVHERFATFEDYWSFHAETGGPIARILADLDDAEADRVRETCREFCAAFRTDDGYAFPGEALVTVAR